MNIYIYTQIRVYTHIQIEFIWIHNRDVFIVNKYKNWVLFRIERFCNNNYVVIFPKLLWENEMKLVWIAENQGSQNGRGNCYENI